MKYSRLKKARELTSDQALDLAGVFGEISVLANGRRDFLMTMFEYGPSGSLDSSQVSNEVRQIKDLLTKIEYLM